MLGGFRTDFIYMFNFKTAHAQSIMSINRDMAFISEIGQGALFTHIISIYNEQTRTIYAYFVLIFFLLLE